MKALTVAAEIREAVNLVRNKTRIQLQEGFLKMRQESLDARSRLGEAERLRHAALEATAKLVTALETIAQIADCRTQHACDEWSLVEDIARNAIRKAAL